MTLAVPVTRTWDAALTALPVAIVGAGPIGLATLLTARFYSPAQIILIDLDDGRLEVALVTADEPRRLATTRLPDVETMHAMTVHKAQGSQARVVTVVMPPDESALLTRELFYTAVTRARSTVRVVGSEAAIRAAIGRRAQRASGLAVRLSTAP